MFEVLHLDILRGNQILRGRDSSEINTDLFIIEFIIKG